MLAFRERARDIDWSDRALLTSSSYSTKDASFGMAYKGH